MITRMLIDARHREETRVAVITGNRIEEFDFESAEHKQLKGNIYLAKVTRVEPSLQAAFIEYGGNRHGFLAFSEIHPDYYQIPREDREALMREELAYANEAAMRAEDGLDELEGQIDDVAPPAADPRDDEADDDGDSDNDGDSDPEAEADGDGDDDAAAGQDGDTADGDGEAGDAAETQDRDGRPAGRRRRDGRKGGRGGKNSGRPGQGRDASSEANGANGSEGGNGRQPPRRRYKIQDVIRRRQVMLVQVVKEERGNKGAALTTYLSLAGRYCVLMPNTMNGGGISRKISSGADRRKLKAMIDDLNLPPTMGCIVRTAGMSRTKVEIKRDFDYLARLWDEIREKTLNSSAPALVHSDSDLIKRAIRDIYHRDIEEVLVEGEDGYRAAKEFMKLLMPSHARRVKQYHDPVSLYQRYGVEDQLAGMLSPVVQLKSGGYLVINPTEALVSIDINSGRSTREHNIEQTAVSTNLEAAAEIARQLRLRDMAGLVVIDFIDMDNGSNVRKVERAMKEALSNDRARIQIGRISGFGLMEMSRQRLRTGVLEASTKPCPHCEGTGLIRTASSAGLSALRLIEEEAARGRGDRIVLRASQEATFYLLNDKRADLRDIENLYHVAVAILPNAEMDGAKMTIEVSGPPPVDRPRLAKIVIEDEDEDPVDDLADDLADAADEADEDEGDDGERAARPARAQPDGDVGEDGEPRRKRKRRRRGRRGRRDDESDNGGDNGGSGADGSADGEGDADASPDEASPDEANADAPAATPAEAPKKGRRRPSRAKPAATASDSGASTDVDVGAVSAEPVADVAADAETVPEAEAEPAAKPVRKRAPRKAAAAKPAMPTEADAPPPVADAAAQADAAPDAAPDADAAPAPKRRTRRAGVSKPVAKDAAAPEALTGEVAASEAAAEAEGTNGEPKRGWWQRTFGG